MSVGQETHKSDLLIESLRQRILVLDGAMGTMIQQVELNEADFRGAPFANHSIELKGCNDLLAWTKPEVIIDIHRRFFEAGADIVETNTFNANAISMADYGLEGHIRKMNLTAVECAKQAIVEAQAGGVDRTLYIAGSIGPTGSTASLSKKVEDPGYRDVTFDQLVAAYYEQIDALIEGGVDLLMPETTFDTLNLKACLFALEKCFDDRGTRLPVMISVTITDASGRTLSGQTLDAFWASISHFDMLSVGINCAFGPAQMRPYVEDLNRFSPVMVSCHPNAGLPNEFGGYDLTPDAMAELLADYASNGWLNIVGGCCGTTPDHIRAIAEAVRDKPPRVRPNKDPLTTYSGLETLVLRPENNFTMVGERTNVTGSRKFSRLICEELYEEALAVAAQQVEAGANVIDINMDEGLLDSEAVMATFLNLIASEPNISRVPIMVDSSKWSVIEAGLKCIQGKSIVNSISLKEGEEQFLHHARLVRRYGAAVVVMAFDEQGQAVTTEDKIRICQRAYKILTEQIGMPAEDIIFDPNILTVATGIEEHNDYAINFIEAVRGIKEKCPGVKISGGVSNISFSFRGNEIVRRAMHSSFLYHAIRAGMDMGIVNAGQLDVYEEIEPELLEKVEDVLFNRRPDATERLVDLAERFKGSGAKDEALTLAWREETVQKRISHALIKGIADFIEARR